MARTTQKRKAAAVNNNESDDNSDRDDQESECKFLPSIIFHPHRPLFTNYSLRSSVPPAPSAPSPKLGKRAPRAARVKAQAKNAEKDSDDDIDSDDLPEHEDDDFITEKKPKAPRKSSNTSINGSSKPKKAATGGKPRAPRAKGKRVGAGKGRGNAASKEDLPVKDDNTLFSEYRY